MEGPSLNNKDIAWLIMMGLFYLEIIVWLCCNILIDLVLVHDVIGRCLVFAVTGGLSIAYSKYFRKKVQPFISSDGPSSGSSSPEQ